LKTKVYESHQRKLVEVSPLPKNKAGIEQSTNFHWWDLSGVSGLLCRLQLNNPPTSVGGIEAKRGGPQPMPSPGK
jgi:hypothetical protein